IDKLRSHFELGNTLTGCSHKLIEPLSQSTACGAVIFLYMDLPVATGRHFRDRSLPCTHCETDLGPAVRSQPAAPAGAVFRSSLFTPLANCSLRTMARSDVVSARVGLRLIPQAGAAPLHLQSARRVFLCTADLLRQR